jgi:prophage maintenance system killer protein
VTELAASQVLFLHARLCDWLREPRGMREVGALRRALDAADAVSGDLFERAAALAVALARHQPFVAANLALSAAAAGVLLRTYDLDLRLEPTDTPELRRLLSGDDHAALVAWLRSRTLPAG